MNAYAALVLLALLTPFLSVAGWLLYGARRNDRQRLAQTLLRLGIEPAGDRRRPCAAERAGHWLAREVALKLRQAGLEAHGRRLVGLSVAAATAALLIVLTRPALGAREVGALLLIVASGPLYVLYQLQQRSTRFAAQFPDALEAIARALQAGHGIDAAIRMIGEETPPPLAPEFARIGQQVVLGVPLGEALRDFQQRINIPEAQYFVTTVVIQREAGGQLAAILAELAALMRRRALFQEKVRALTAESRFTAWFIGATPLLYLGYRYLFDPQSIHFFLHDPTGQSLLRLALGLIATGWVLLRLLLRVRF